MVTEPAMRVAAVIAEVEKELSASAVVKILDAVSWPVVNDVAWRLDTDRLDSVSVFACKVLAVKELPLTIPVLTRFVRRFLTSRVVTNAVPAESELVRMRGLEIAIG